MWGRNRLKKKRTGYVWNKGYYKVKAISSDLRSPGVKAVKMWRNCLIYHFAFQ